MVRAIYHGSDTYMLDDVLSAVDAHVAQSIIQHAIMGPLMSKETRILCTHNIQVRLFLWVLSSRLCGVAASGSFIIYAHFYLCIDCSTFIRQ